MRPTFVSMNVTTQYDNATSDQTTTMPTMAGETGRDLCERRGELSGNARRNIERRWLSLFGMSFSVFEMYDSETVAKYEAAFPVDLKNMRLKRTAPVRIAAGKSPASNEVPVMLAAQNKWRKPALIAALIIPTLASVTNTFNVSHAMSSSQSTAALITGVASATSLLFLWAGVRGVGAWFVVAATLGFEAFCNACAVFTALMGTMAYSLTTVSGAPSHFLDMVANFTGRDHQDVATVIAYFTAAMICGAQVSSIYELKK
jgi:hypothetical protein